MSKEKSNVFGTILGLASVAGAAALGYFLAKKADEYIKVQRDNEFVDDPDPFGDLDDEDFEDYADVDPNEETIFSITVTKSKAPEAESASENPAAESASEESTPVEANAAEVPETEVSIEITDECPGECPDEAEIPASEANEE